MGTRFRKSKKIGATRFTVSKKSFGTSFGGKVAGVSFNSKHGARARVSIPGTGVSYSTKIGGSSSGGHGCLWWLFIGWWWWIIALPARWISNAIKKKQNSGRPSQESASAITDISLQSGTPSTVSHDTEVLAFCAELGSIPRVEIIKSDPSCKWRNPDTMTGIHVTNITRQTNMEKLFPIIVVDTETTGIDAAKHRIVELSAIKLGAGFEPESCFTTLINPGKAIPECASDVHHITDEMVADAPSFPEVASCFSDFIAGCNIAGHNIKFDLEFLYAAGMDLPSKVRYYDTMDLAKKVLTSPYRRMKYDHEAGGMVESEDYDVENYKLVTLCDYYGIYRNDAHRSLSDCLATAKVLRELVKAKTTEV